MFGLDLNEATDWQRNMYNHTYVFDKDGCGTVLLFHWSGAPAADVQTKGLIKIPIASLEPANRDSLRRQLKRHYCKMFESEPESAIDSIVGVVMATALRQLDHRPPGHRYTTTDDEQRQRLKVFVEANRHPHISHLLFGTPGRSIDMLVSPEDKKLANRLLLDEKADGFYEPGNRIIGITNTHPRYIADIMVEENSTMRSICPHL